MQLRLSIRYVAVVSAIATVVAVAPSSLAGAASPKGGACVDELCLYADALGGGQDVRLHKLGVSNKVARKMNNDATSAVNATEGAVFLYDKRDGTGDSYCLEPLSKFGDLGAFSDKATSTKLTKRHHCPV